MQILIDVDEEIITLCKARVEAVGSINTLSDVTSFAIANGTPLPDDSEILTKEAYADLCRKAAGIKESE